MGSNCLCFRIDSSCNFLYVVVVDGVLIMWSSLRPIEEFPTLDMYFLFWQNISLQSLKCNIKNVVSQLWIFNLSPCKISLNIHAFAFVQSFPMHSWMMERSSDWNLLKKILKNPNAGSWISKDYIMVWRKVRIISILFFTVGTFMFVHIRMK